MKAASVALAFGVIATVSHAVRGLPASGSGDDAVSSEDLEEACQDVEWCARLPMPETICVTLDFIANTYCPETCGTCPTPAPTPAPVLDCDTEEGYEKFATTSPDKLRIDVIDAKFKTLDECFAYCTETNDCASFLYLSDNGKCRIYSANLMEGDNLNTDYAGRDVYVKVDACFSKPGERPAATQAPTPAGPPVDTTGEPALAPTSAPTPAPAPECKPFCTGNGDFGFKKRQADICDNKKCHTCEYPPLDNDTEPFTCVPATPAPPLSCNTEDAYTQTQNQRPKSIQSTTRIWTSTDGNSEAGLAEWSFAQQHSPADCMAECDAQNAEASREDYCLLIVFSKKAGKCFLYSDLTAGQNKINSNSNFDMYQQSIECRPPAPPTPAPTAAPTPAPTAAPTASPTPAPTPAPPTPAPTAAPTAAPTPAPPTPAPTPAPPTPAPTAAPTAAPTQAPTAAPTYHSSLGCTDGLTYGTCAGGSAPILESSSDCIEDDSCLYYDRLTVSSNDACIDACLADGRCSAVHVVSRTTCYLYEGAAFGGCNAWGPGTRSNYAAQIKCA